MTPFSSAPPRLRSRRTGTTFVDNATASTAYRYALEAARAQLALPALTYTDPTITPGATNVKAAHFGELRDGVR